MPPKSANQVVSAAVKPVATGEMGSGATAANPQPPKKKKTDAKAKGMTNKDKADVLHPPLKIGATTNRLAVGKKDHAATSAAANTIKTPLNKNTGNNTAKGSNTSKQGSSGNVGARYTVVGGSAGGGGSRPSSTSQNSSSMSQMQQAKLERAQTAKRELAEMDAIERAFREDATVWAGPTNVGFPRRYGVTKEDGSDGNGEVIPKKDTDKGPESSIHNPYLSFYSSQSRGWMYGEGHAGIGGRSWMEATAPSNEAEKKKKKKDKKIDDAKTNKSNPSFLIDEVAIIENSLRANGLTRHDVTPTAYACFLEQARRYALELLADAQDYAMHAQRTTLPALLPVDLLLAAEMREDGGGGTQGVASTLPTPVEVADLASEVNRVPLPPVPANCYNGIAMPPKEQQLTARTYDVVNAARLAQRMMMGGDLPLTAEETTVGGDESWGSKGPSSKSNRRGSYGAGKGRQISVHIKSKTPAPFSRGSATGVSTSGTAAATAKAAAAGKRTTKKSTSKGQKRKLTEL